MGKVFVEILLGDGGGEGADEELPRLLFVTRGGRGGDALGARKTVHAETENNEEENRLARLENLSNGSYVPAHEYIHSLYKLVFIHT